MKDSNKYFKKDIEIVCNKNPIYSEYRLLKKMGVFGLTLHAYHLAIFNG